MSGLQILQFPDPRLKITALPIEIFDDALHSLAHRMFETMYAAHGIGLAATQVNVPQRVIVIDLSADKSHPLCLVNPKIIARDGPLLEQQEGCLSFPGIYAIIRRSHVIQVTFSDLTGTTHRLDAEGLLSICIQHEIDHLDGVTFYDHCSPLKQLLIRKKLAKIHKTSL